MAGRETETEYTIKLYPEGGEIETREGRFRAELLRGERVVFRESVDWPSRSIGDTLAFMASLIAHERARKARRLESPRGE